MMSLILLEHKRGKKIIWFVCPDLFWPDAQMEVEACLQQQILHIIWVDGEVEVQGVSQQLVGFLITLPERIPTLQRQVPQPQHGADLCIQLQ